MTLLEDASGFTGSADELFKPESEEEVCALLREASERAIAVTVCGSRTSLTGGCIPDGGWELSLEKLQTLYVSRGRANAGAGVTLQKLQSEAAHTGQFYAPDPTEWTASVGGTIATNASGSRSFRFGSTRRHILGLRVAFMNGTVREFRRGDPVDFPVPSIPLPRTTKNTAGYLLDPGMEWIDLIAGSEGTLGLVLDAEVQLLPKPAGLLSGVVFFSGDSDALDAVDQWRSLPRLNMIEYFDERSLKMMRARHPEIPERAQAALFIEQEDGDVDQWSERVSEDSWFAAGDQDRERFRRFRHALPELVNDTMRRRGFLKLGSDFAVPFACNREMLAFYHARLRPLDYVIFGHIGDAHVHVNILPASPEEFEAGKALLTEFARHAVSLGGTVSAEHGLGKRKAHLLALQYTEEQIQAMRSVKRRLDPQWLLNRGNLFSCAG
jgi:FAD/FMN-containing dehydrogenase